MLTFDCNCSPPLFVAGIGGHVFSSTTFAVDPGMGDHISHKINHSRRRPNARAREGRTSKGEKCIVFRALRVRSPMLFLARVALRTAF